jgi:glycosyltransferase involved in cell wall biosynthesis
LLLERVLDALFHRPNRAPELDEITAVIKTFERPKKLAGLVKSIKRLYPTLKIIVIDDSKQPRQLAGVETIILPYDSGVSAGRNAGLSAVTTKYMMCLDDDFVFNRHTELLNAFQAMETHPQIDILAGEVIYLPLRIVHDYSHTGVFETGRTPLHEPGSYIGPYPVHLKVPNFYIGRSDKIRLVGWDDNLKRMDHADFFSRAVGVLTSVQDRSFKVLHYPTYFNKTYMERKTDNRHDAMVLQHKYHRQEKGGN